MMEVLTAVIKNVFVHPEIATIIISMFPIIELKGAIPLGMSIDLWGENALNGNEAFIYSLIGSCVVVPIIALVFSPILKWMKTTKVFKRVANKIENKVRCSSKNIENKIKSSNSVVKNKIIKMLGVFLFVAMPLPLTGVWTGTCVGVVIGLSFWQVVISAIAGNIVAGLIIKFVCSAFPNFTLLILIILLGVIVLMGVVSAIKKFLNRKNSFNSNKN